MDGAGSGLLVFLMPVLGLDDAVDRYVSAIVISNSL